MARLIIIGNGYDLAHNSKTSYENFSEWLCNEYPLDINGKKHTSFRIRHTNLKWYFFE